MTTLDLMGWDLVHATTFERLSAAITASPRRPASFQAQDAQENVTVSGNWGRWELSSGSPGNMLWLDCAVSTGSFVRGTASHDLAGAVFTVQFGLAWVGSRPKGGGGLRPASSGAASPRLIGQTRVSVMGAGAYLLSSMMNQILAQQVAALDSDFMSIVVGGAGQPGDHPWLNPSESDYACAPLPGDQRKGIFAILSMTEARTAAGRQRAVDRRILDGAPAGSNAALVVGPRLTVAQLITPTAKNIIQGAGDDDFSLDASGTVVYNNKTITWGTFDYQENGSTNQIQPIIPRGNAKVALDGELIHISLADLQFPYPSWHGPGDINISFGTEQFCRYSFTVNGGGNLVMAPDPGAEVPSCNVTVLPDQQVQAFQIGLDVLLQVLLSIVGGVASQIFQPAAEAAEATGGGVVAKVSEVQMTEIVAKYVTPAQLEDAEVQAAEQSAEATVKAGTPGFVQQFRSAIAGNKYSLVSIVLRKLVYLPLSMITQVATMAAKHDYDKLPALDPFVNEAVRPVGWPMDKSFKITGGALRGSLTFYGKLS